MATTTHPRRTLSYRLKRLAPWAGGLVLIAGIVVAIVALAGNKNAPAQAKGSAAQAVAPPAAAAKKPKTVPLAKDATKIAALFVKTAVARKDLAAAWKITGPNIHGGLTYKEWLTGNIPVVPYPVANVTAPVRFKIDWSYKTNAQIEIALLPSKGTVKPQIFAMGLKKVGHAGKTRWLVDNWVPRSSPPVPQAVN